MTIHIHHGDQLCEGDEGEPGGPEAVEQSEPVLARPRGEHEADGEAGDRHPGCQHRLPHLTLHWSVRTDLWFLEVTHLVKTGVVKQGGGEGLDDADLGAETKGEKHQEEQSGPDINIEQ